MDDNIVSDEIIFLASLPMTKSAITFGSDGSTVKLAIPLEYINAVKRIMDMSGKVMEVRIKESY